MVQCIHLSPLGITFLLLCMTDCESVCKHESSSRTTAAILVDAVLRGTSQLLHTDLASQAPCLLTVFFMLAKQREEVQGQYSCSTSHPPLTTIMLTLQEVSYCR